MWFDEEVLSKRQSFTVVCFLAFTVVQKTSIDIAQCLMACFSCRPVIAFESFKDAIINWRIVQFYVLFDVTCVAFAILHVQFYRVDVNVFKTRFEAVQGFLSFYNVVHMVSMSALGLFCTKIYLDLMGTYNNSSAFTFISNVSSSQALLFILLHGAWSGLLFSYRYLTCGRNVITFELFQDPILMQLRNKLAEIVYDSIRSVLQFLHWYYILCIVLDLTTLHFFPRFSMSLSALLFHINIVPTLLAAIVTSTLMFISWNFYLHLFNVIISKRYEFEIIAKTQRDQDRVLKGCLGVSNMKVLQYLAFMDMRWLVQFSSQRRRLFFTLSQPGGHPRQWIALSNMCFPMLTDLIQNLKKLSAPKLNPKIELKAVGGQNLNLFHLPSPCLNSFSCTSPFQSASDSMIDRNLPPPDGNFFQKFCLAVCIRKQQLFEYFFNELPNIEACMVFNSCQLHIWIVEALGFFVEASYREVSHGVILQTLPQILTTLMDLKFADEKLPIGMMSTKNPLDSKFHRNAIFQRHKLRSAIESALYRIVLILKTDIRGVSIDNEYKICLEKYLTFQQ